MLSIKTKLITIDILMRNFKCFISLTSFIFTYTHFIGEIKISSIPLNAIYNKYKKYLKKETITLNIKNNISLSLVFL